MQVGAAGSCVTLKVWPPTVMAVCRAELVVFACTEKLTEPLPDPLPDVIDTHDAPPDVLHVQPAWVVTAN